MNWLTIFLTLALLETILNIILAIRNFKEGKAQNTIFAKGALAGACTLLFYSISLRVRNYFSLSLFNSLYFVSIDFMLFYMAEFFMYYVNYHESKMMRSLKRAAALYILFDTTCMLTNPFFEFVISYQQSLTWTTHYYYVPHLLYQIHLLFSYLCILVILLLLLKKITSTPKVYRFRYRICIITILITVLANAVFLYFPYKDMLDYSVLLYSPIYLIIYWCWRYYARQKVQLVAQKIIVDEMERPIILFDFEEQLAMTNQNIDFLNLPEKISLYEFMERYQLDVLIENTEKSAHFQCQFQEDPNTTYRCDYNVIRDEKGRILCRFFIFTDNSLEVDLLTGFRTNMHYLDMLDQKGTLQYPVALAVCDLNRLSNINSIYGRDEGDRAILTVARALKQISPKDSFFFRLTDANLMVVCPNTDLMRMRQYMDELRESVKLGKEEESTLDVQTAISVAASSNDSLSGEMKTALKSMRMKKLMDRNSEHSSLLDSMEEILHESDSTTAEHVARTQKLGEKLGLQIGLTDMELSNLELLCLLHDIGKIGIPLEILNKPYPLNDDEWEVMKSHVEKGYRIAKSSKELSDIAEQIRHHHESWDGSGYPDGLSKESIPLLSRIIAVVDTYDAMVHDRPYRNAVSKKTALEELKRCAGTQFDPSIVNEFVKMMEEDAETDESGLLEESTADNMAEIIRPRGLNDRSIDNKNIEQMTEVGSIQYTSYILDGDSNIIKIDSNFEKITGYSKKDVNSYQLRQIDLVSMEDQDSYREIEKKKLSESHIAYIEHKLMRKDGTTKYVYSMERAYFDSVNREARREVILSEINNSKLVKEMINKAARQEQRKYDSWINTIRKDALTGLLTRTAYKNDVEMEFIERHKKMVFFMVDVDNFKEYNDTNGHLAGDELLKNIADCLKLLANGRGLVGRMGGDEFSMLIGLDSDTTDGNLEDFVSETFDALSDKIKVYQQSITFSMGAIKISKNIQTFNEAYRLADEALYQAKTQGRNQLCLR